MEPLDLGAFERRIDPQGRDLHLALDAANRAHQPLPMAQSIAVQWDTALQAGLGDRDVVGAYLALAGDRHPPG